MALPCYVKITAEKQGNIEGSSESKGREKLVEALEINHKVTIPTDGPTGKSTGKRLHQPFIITKQIDKATPKLYQALCTGEQLKEVKVDHYMVDKSGKETLYFTQVLKGAQVVEINQIVPNVKTEGQLPPMEKISLKYEDIKWTHKDGVESQDNWRNN